MRIEITASPVNKMPCILRIRAALNSRELSTEAVSDVAWCNNATRGANVVVIILHVLSIG
jgi:hypothetical protein